jgi:tetratricopeptide (TPR) repeat protein
MYQRNISHILSSLGIALVLFVVYHAWFKSIYLPFSEPTPPPRLTTTDKAEPESLLFRTSIEQEQARELRRQMRLLALGVPPPDNPYADILRDAQEELEKHQARGAEAKLMELPPKALAEAKIAHYTAVLWNNLGVEHERTNDTKAASRAYAKAVSLEPTNRVALLNLAHTYWAQRDPQLTPEFLDRIIALAPDEPFPHLALADLLQEQDRLTDAARHLELAADRAQQDPNLRSYLQAVTAKVKRTVQVEQQFTAQSSAHFTVKWDGEEDQTTWMAVLDILEDAYRDIGQRLGYFPEKPIVVVLHTKATFQGATGSPAWADGLFDPVLGRIQIPTQGALTDRTWLTRVVRHEFVHALLHERLGLEASGLPSWLNEGLAMRLAGDSWPDLDHVLSGVAGGEIKLIPLNMLEGGWGRFPGELALVAYLEGHSATGYLIDRFGMEKVRELLMALKSHQHISGAIEDRLYLPYDQFQRQWVDSINTRLGKATG